MSDPEAPQPDGVRGARPPAIDAVILRFEGVVADYSTNEAEIWKDLIDGYLSERSERTGEEYEPFDRRGDYYGRVAGMSSRAAVSSLLAVRGITLPLGRPNDNSTEETVWGLANQADESIRSWLQTHPIGVLPGAASFLALLADAEIKIAIISPWAMVNGILENAGLRNSVHVEVIANNIANMSYPNSSAGKALLEAARHLRGEPSQMAVLESSLAGIGAARQEGFGLVIGVDRESQEDRMVRAGAHWIINDPAELCVNQDRRLGLRTVASLPSIWSSEEEIKKRVKYTELAVFLDYDGTLTPIVDDPEDAVLETAMRDTLAELSKNTTVAIISGRDLPDLRQRLGLSSSIFLAGSHGFDIAGGGKWRETLEKGTEFLPLLDRAESELHQRLNVIQGIHVERKRFSIAIHYRHVQDKDLARLKTDIESILDQEPRLRGSSGKKVYQIQPRIDWDKGKALTWILGKLGLNRNKLFALYIGDDITDEDAFRTLPGWGVGIVVRDGDRRTSAEYRLDNPEDVRAFLNFLIQVRS